MRRLTWDDLVLLREEHEGDRQELIDGRLVATPVCTPRHQIALSDSTRLLVSMVEEGKLGLALPLPVGVRFTPDNVLIPDAVFVARHRRHVVGPTVTVLTLAQGDYEMVPVGEGGLVRSRVLPELKLTLDQVFADM